MKVALCLLMFFMATAMADIVVLNTNTNGTNPIYTISYMYRYKGIDRNLTGVLVQESTALSVFNKIVLADKTHPTLAEKRALELQSQGALGVVMIEPNYPPGFYEFSSYKLPVENILIPVYEVGYTGHQTLKTYFNTTTSLNVIMVPRVSRYTQAVGFNKMIGWMVLCSAFSAVNIALVVWKLILYGRYNRFAPNVAITCLFIEIIVNAVRLPLELVDPIFVTGMIPTLVLHVLSTGHLPFMIISSLTFILYLEELLSFESIVVKTFITSLRIPFIIISIIMFLIEWATSLSRGIFFFEDLIIPNIIMYMALFIVLGIYCIVISSRILKLKNGAKVKESSIRVLCIGILYLIIVICQGFIGVSSFVMDFATYPFDANKACWFFTFFGASAISLLQILNFMPTKPIGTTTISTTSQASSKLTDNE